MLLNQVDYIEREHFGWNMYITRKMNVYAKRTKNLHWYWCVNAIKCYNFSNGFQVKSEIHFRAQFSCYKPKPKLRSILTIENNEIPLV